MALKKSELYSSLWQSCDVLRGGMDASQYKDYVLVLLFIKYISDKYDGQYEPPITIPKGASFKDMVALKGNPNIGDLINKNIIAPLERENQLSGFPDFNDSAKLGSGKDMVDRISKLIAVFENPALDFSANRADGDDILGDAYEYLMRHFATESGKSKGQFYTPAEVSRILARVIGIHEAKTTTSTTAYDPTAGSGSLLLKVADAAPTKITLYGQEMDTSTASLARMNMILHDNAEAEIKQGNTLADPKFKSGDTLQTFDYVVANPPFSVKNWSSGFDPLHDLYDRFSPYGIPPDKQGDYAFLLHIVRSMKSTGKAACILPHGVLFRGNAEAEIRKNLIQRGYFKAIIGLPANLFYGTGIPACIIVLDKEEAADRKGIFMIDASKGFIKDGNKNRLREQDIHKIVDTFSREDQSHPSYARLVPISEIADPKNDFNLNIPRYIDSTEPEDLQDIDGHLRGGIPERDVDALAEYWKVMPGLQAALFEPMRPGYVQLAKPSLEIKETIFSHPEFSAFTTQAKRLFTKWQQGSIPKLKGFGQNDHPKPLIQLIAEDLLSIFKDAALIDAYDVYQHLMDYWGKTMQDDCYIVASDGWVAEPSRIIETDKKGKSKDKGWTCDLVPKDFVVARYFTKEQTVLDEEQSKLEAAMGALSELEEEHGGEDGFLGSLDKIAKAEVNAQLKKLKTDKEAKEEIAVLKRWLELSESESSLKRSVKEMDAALDKMAYEKYSKLSKDEIKALVVDDKWMAKLSALIQAELDRVSQTLTGRIRQLAERYKTPLPKIIDELDASTVRVNGHLKKMGAVWN
jgi:type I restriction enzyme M protein